MDSDEQEQKLDETRMPLWEHLDALRGALVRSLICILIVTCVTYRFAEQILYFLEKPILDALPQGSQKLYFTGITDKFFVYLKASIYSAILIASPYLLWELWRFVSPGLYKKEKKMVLPFITLGSLFFVLGVGFGYFIVIPYGYKFLVNYGSASEVPLITLAEYFKLTLQLLLMMGAVFELPVVLMLLAAFGIVQPALLSKIRGQAYVALSILAAFITPTPDAFTMVLVMVPMFLLYEISIFLVKTVSVKS